MKTCRNSCTVCNETRATGCRSYSDKHQFTGDCRTSSGDGLAFVQEQVQPGVDNARRESRGDIGKANGERYLRVVAVRILLLTISDQAIIDQRTQDSNIRNDV